MAGRLTSRGSATGSSVGACCRLQARIANKAHRPSARPASTMARAGFLFVLTRRIARSIHTGTNAIAPYSVQTASAMKNPSRLPTMTCGRVWPWISFTGLKAMWSRLPTLEPSVLSALAWTPAERLTPRASRMTTSEKKTLRANRSEDGPLLNAAAVDMDTARALWLDGMPPVRHKRVAITSRNDRARLPNRLMRALANCAVNKLRAADRNNGFRMRAARNGIRVGSIEPISGIMRVRVKHPWTFARVFACLTRSTDSHTVPPWRIPNKSSLQDRTTQAGA